MSKIPLQDFSLISLCDATNSGKLYSIVPDDGSGDFAVARNSTATYVGADGLIKTALTNEPRIEFNPDGSYKGLLVEPQRTNLLLRSEEFDNAYWGKINSTVTANDAVAPDGTTTADKLVEDTSNGFHYVFAPEVARGAAGGLLSNSFFAKAGERRFITFAGGHSGAHNYFVIFDLQDGVVVTSGVTGSGVLSSFNIELIGNGWYRCTVVGSVSASFTHRLFYISLIENPANIGVRGQEEYTGDGTSGIFIWGAQLEEASTASSYIKTEASTVTRVADVVSKTGASALIGQTEGTIYAEYFFDTTQANIGSNDNVIFWLSDNTSNNLITLTHYGAGTQSFTRRVSYFVRTNNVNQVLIRSSQLTSGLFKVAATYKENSFKLFVNGEMVASQLTGTIPATNQINLNNFLSSNVDLIKEYKSLAILPRAITQAEAIQLTS
jgi:hypothetical protein